MGTFKCGAFISEVVWLFGPSCLVGDVTEMRAAKHRPVATRAERSRPGGPTSRLP